MTHRDPVLSRVRDYVLRGWTSSTDVDPDLQPYKRKLSELSVQDGCLLWGNRVVIPWDWPDRPWARIHADYAGPFMSKMFLLMVDAHSKWLQVHVATSATSRSTFATHGLSELLVTDNGSAFTSKEFEEFLQKNGIRHVTSAPYHPATNGSVERAVQTFKTAMKKATSDTPIETRVARFLFHYRLTPQSTTGISPAELLLGQRPRTHLDQLRPDLAHTVRKQ